MKYLLSLPINAKSDFHELNKKSREKWFCTSDPKEKRLGSGGGTTWLLEECHRNDEPEQDFNAWLKKEKRVLVHAGGQSRRLPAYAASGKVSLPVPIFRWERGQRLSQDLLSLQMSLFEKILQASPENIHTLIASGDVYIRTDEALQSIPEADVVCYGVWVDSSLATRHGVFASKRETPDVLDTVLQKPSLQTLEQLSRSHFFLMDIGLWLLSNKAVQLLRKRSYNANGDLHFYDLYSDFGLALGVNPSKPDEEVNQLTVKILPLAGGEFYHYGTGKEMISSTLAVQNKVFDQRLIMHKKIKPNPAIFTQNAEVGVAFTEENNNIWIENSVVGRGWSLTSDNVITGVPENSWEIHLPKGICVDIAPISESDFAVRPYGINDSFKGDISSADTLWMGKPFTQWLDERKISLKDIQGNQSDIQFCCLFPVVKSALEIEKVLKWMIDSENNPEGKDIWLKAQKYSADELLDCASLPRLFGQREELRKRNYGLLADNFEKSVFYQLDLSDVAREYNTFKLDAPDVLPKESGTMLQIHNRMLRSRIFSLQNHLDTANEEEQQAFCLLRNGLIDALSNKKTLPRLNVYPDQIVWGRSPVRIDLAGGWTDTPPFSLYSGGNVVNLAIELNGQPPLQVYVKPCKEFHIMLRSIDMSATEIVDSFDALRDFKKVGSPFSISKAALALCGFLPEFSSQSRNTLAEQLKDFGSGIELTILSAIPAGSGLGTSSILAGTVLGALNDFCSLNWSKQDICTYTLILEQLLTTGGGWQDQYGGIFHGVKLLQSDMGFAQKPQINWLPDHLFTDINHKSCHLLYYTGLTRVAKGILAEIVRGMFLNSSSHLNILNDMKLHALEMASAIQRGNFKEFGKLVLKTWEQKKAIDSGTNPPQVEKIIDLIKDYTLGYKLPGAGGGGYLYLVAKDAEAATRIRKTLEENKPNDKARFVEMELSNKGFQVSRS